MHEPVRHQTQRIHFGENKDKNAELLQEERVDNCYICARKISESIYAVKRKYTLMQNQIAARWTFSATLIANQPCHFEIRHQGMDSFDIFEKSASVIP